MPDLSNLLLPPPSPPFSSAPSSSSALLFDPSCSSSSSRPENLDGDACLPLSNDALTLILPLSAMPDLSNLLLPSPSPSLSSAPSSSSALLPDPSCSSSSSHPENIDGDACLPLSNAGSQQSPPSSPFPSLLLSPLLFLSYSFRSVLLLLFLPPRKPRWGRMPFSLQLCPNLFLSLLAMLDLSNLVLPPPSPPFSSAPSSSSALLSDPSGSSSFSHRENLDGDACLPLFNDALTLILSLPAMPDLSNLLLPPPYPHFSSAPSSSSALLSDPSCHSSSSRPENLDGNTCLPLSNDALTLILSLPAMPDLSNLLLPPPSPPFSSAPSSSSALLPPVPKT